VSSVHWRRAAAYAAIAITIIAAATTVALYVKTRGTPVDLSGPRAVNVGLGAVALAFAAVGALILVRRQVNAVGWLFAGIGVSLALSALAQEYAVFAVIGRSAPLFGGPTAAWLQQWSVLTCVTSGVGLLLLLFPDGRPVSRPWRAAAWAIAAGLLLFVLGYLVDPGPLQSPFSSVDNPFGIAGAHAVATVAIPVGFFLSVFAILAGALSVVLRFRRSRGVERQQVKWLAAVGVVFALALVANLLTLDTGESVAIAFLILVLVGLPIATGLAILRYRLYEIDVVINRTLVYGSLTALLAGAYVGLVLLFQLALHPLTGGSGLAIALSTLAVAALFRPARARIQALVDRRFYRRKYDAARTLEAFAARLREEVDLDALRVELASVVAETMQPAHVSVWLRAAAPVTPAVTISRRLLSTKETR
jgi:cytochrome b subunit of formate dehydrogenase